MSKIINVLLPCEFDNNKPGPGHKKDLVNIINFFLNSNYIVNIAYSDRKKVYRNNKVLKLSDYLNQIKRGKEKLLVGPLYLFRSVIWKFPSTTYIYVADSPMKTSICNFFINPIYFYRILYNYFSELAIKNKNIIVASQEEFSWFSSCGHDIKKIHLLFPSPSFFDNKSIINPVNNKVLIYNPNGLGINITREYLTKLNNLLESEEFNIDIIITGSQVDFFNEDLKKHLNLNVKCVKFIDDIDGLISSCKLSVLTDVGGSGLCNRSVQIIKNNCQLICTPDSVRGSNLYYDENVFISNNISDMANETILKLINKNNFRYSDSLIKHENKFNEQLNCLKNSIERSL